MQRIEVISVCRQAVFQNGQLVVSTLQEGPESPPKALASLFLLLRKCQESLKLMATNWKRKGNQRNIYSLRNGPIFFHLYIRVQTVFISSGFCEGNGEEKRHMYGKIIFLNPSKIFFYYFIYHGNTVQAEPYVLTNSISIVNFGIGYLWTKSDFLKKIYTWLYFLHHNNKN